MTHSGRWIESRSANDFSSRETGQLERASRSFRLLKTMLLHASEGQRRATERSPGSSTPRKCENSMKGEVMKIVVIGGTGLIGSKVVSKLTQLGHEALAAAPN